MDKTHFEHWSCEDVQTWLSTLKLPQVELNNLTKSINNYGIDGETLSFCETAEEFQEIFGCHPRIANQLKKRLEDHKISEKNKQNQQEIKEEEKLESYFTNLKMSKIVYDHEALVEKGEKRFQYDHNIQINNNNNNEEIYQALNTVCCRAFGTKFIALWANDIVKGKATGDIIILEANGDKKFENIKEKIIYEAKVTFDNQLITNAYFDELCCNALLIKSDNVIFVAEDGKLKGISKMIKPDKDYTKIFEDRSNQLQIQYAQNNNEVQLMIKPKAPAKNGRAFFTGLVVGGTFNDSNISEVYKIDKYSEYVGVGAYPDNAQAFPKAVAATFDGIAIDKNTRIIIYEEKNFQGKILLDKSGPAIINNMIWKNDKRYDHCNTDIFPDLELQNNYPISCRIWSDSDMHKWSYGSLKVFSI